MRVRPAKHLLTVWNPAYADSAMDGHLELLLDWAERHRRGEVDEDSVYVWWAKLRSVNRQQPLPHADDILALQAQIDDGVETHLYMTDYRSLYVAHLEEVIPEDLLKEHPEETDHAPAYYQERPADFWFLLSDIRMLVADDTLAVVEELKHLRNTRYHDRPVSLYGGMVELPLLVTREDDTRWFADKDVLTEGRLWAERDFELRGEVERMGRELRDNLLGRDVWGALEPATRTFLAAAEAVYRTRREDPRFDFTGPALSYAKAIETELNTLIFGTLRGRLARARPAEREVYVDGRKQDLGGPLAHHTLGTMQVLLRHADVVQRELRAALPQDGVWLVSELPYTLDWLINLRNPAAHSVAVRRDAVTEARDVILGIGQEGLIVRIARAKLRRHVRV